MEITDKIALRRLVKGYINNETPVILKQYSQNIMSRIEALDEFHTAERIGIFWPLPDEPDTRDFIEKWCNKKQFMLPVVSGDEMRFAEYRSECPLGVGCFGIHEPLSGGNLTAWDMDLIIVPGVAFTLDGHRLGRGKGFYDKFLVDSIVYKVGICFPCQIVDSIPHEPHDITMNKVITAI